VIPSNWQTSAGFWQLGVFVALVLLRSSAAASDFRFDRDTIAFQNATVLKYKNGVPFLRARSTSNDPANKYTRRCFVMARTVMQFRKFAQFAPRGAIPNLLSAFARFRELWPGTHHYRQMSESFFLVMPICAR